jgi:hypothetical protein
MKKRWSYAITITILLVIISGLATGCGLLSKTNSPTPALTPPSSSGPADIIGRVTIANNVITGNKVYTPLRSGYQFWIVQTSVRNNGYQAQPMVSTDLWYIATGLTAQGQPESILGYRSGWQGFPSEWQFNSLPTTIPQGQSGEMIFCFDVPAGLNPNNYWICYRWRDAHHLMTDVLSFSKLVTTGTVAEVYDWDLKKVRTDIFSATINGKVIPLQLIKSFTGDNSKIVDFTADKSPVIVTWGTTATSQIQSKFEWSWQSEADNTIGTDLWTIYYSLFNTNYKILDSSGKYRLRIQSSGCSWWVKVGVELGG